MSWYMQRDGHVSHVIWSGRDIRKIVVDRGAVSVKCFK